MTQQLAFDLPHRTARGREDFFVSSTNAQALAALDAWRTWPGSKMVLTGPPAAGKTHLAHVWAAASGAQVHAASTLDHADIPTLATQPAVVIEDCETLGSDPIAQTALFHLHNMLAATGAALLMTAATAPRDWGFTLPDLASRVQAAPVTRLDPPDDALLSAVLVKLFADRQITVTPALIAYVLPRMDRSFAAARALVAALDTAALARGTGVTRALAATVLDNP
ncbi:DnaA ATPase domain-containing protein [Pseudorhodobacter ferrugineus]|uniref:DnaA ATPase domain-containing protein n=1 Tax=Pseudorhodobacter ferrugineus TaxID=77008 RepID=UPI0003B363CE|nr:DnaA/Hda family protein [Pseudorhodobacter ferrugineus]